MLQLGEAKSLPFVIGDEALAKLPDQLLEFMRQQRCGYNPWLGVKCHQHDGRTAYGPLPAGTPTDAIGGWHDAGDMLKYHMTSGNATAQMLLAHAIFRRDAPEGSAFPDRVDARGDMGPTGFPTFSTKLAGASIGCSSSTLHPTSSITRWPTTAIMSASACRKMNSPTTGGARGVHASSISQMAARKGCGNSKANRPV